MRTRQRSHGRVLRTCNTSSLGYFFANSSTTLFICVHGSAHGAQKLIRDMRFRSSESRVWKWSGEVTSCRLESCSELVVAVVVVEEDMIAKESLAKTLGAITVSDYTESTLSGVG